ncbi:MAG: hypothetical protein JWM02_3673 [Frankiales bacterium]|nr:hypothetical protein [Frankiales bacterium]
MSAPEGPSVRGDGTVRATLLRPYPEGTPLIAVSEAAWEEARTAECEVPELQDALANANAYAERLPGLIAAYLLTHVSGNGGSGWQEGHDYAMTEAARLVRERWFDLPAAAHYRGHGVNGETTGCDCAIGKDHDLDGPPAQPSAKAGETNR